MNSAITVQLFARLRETAGRDRLELPIPPEGCSIAALIETLKDHPQLGESIRTSNVLAAVNQTMARAEDRVEPGDEVAFFPPVTGG